ncbi:MAG: hypothetical protein HFJ41_03600 [Clostridia bacterium]|nr:hypothetical protein [Clostridia bacterium]
MSNQKNKISKLCSFYVSDWHLITMLLPYINKKINEEVEIATVLEKDIENNVKTLVEKLNLKNERKILKINWKNKSENIENIVKDEIGKEILIIVNGSKDFIRKSNDQISNYLELNSNKFENTNIKIVDCYEIVEFNGSIIEILDEHDKILNTSGEKEINEVFEDYNRKEKIS